MKTLLIALYPYNAQGLDSWHDHGAGMTYVAAKNAGCEIDFLDMKSLFSDKQLKDAIKGYDLIAFGLKSSYYSIGMKVIEMAKEQNSQVMVGGYHVTAAPSEILGNPDIDWVFQGESEITFPDFLKDPDFYPREIVGEKPPNLDNLPFVDHSIFREPLENCFGWWHGGKLKNMTTVITARGCPYKCGFCQPLEDNHFGKILRRRSVDSVIAELRQSKALYNPDCVMIHDDTFFVQPEWVEEFVEKYPEIGLPFWAAARADGICKYPDLVRRLVNVGWNLISVGFESGSQRILDKMKKGTTIEQNLEAAQIIRDAGAKIYANYILGLPWETKEDIQATVKMADKIAAEMPSWAFFTPYPGCELGEECINKGWSLLDRNHYDRCPFGQKVKNVDYGYIDKVLKGLREEPNPEFCDIIIPSYENEQYTVDCLNSIKEHTKEGTYRIIWIDNGSKNTSKVDQVIEEMNHLSIKLPTNDGFVTAVNKGLEVSTAPTVCLLNNDTKVSARWLEKLTTSLYKDKQLGIIGALTQEGIGEGMDSHHSLSLHSRLLPKLSKMSLSDINKYLEKHYSGRTTAIPFVAFLCALIKREVINKVGHLDPNFVMGMWDDNDYNRSVRKAGYRTELAIDTCIYHKGRATFDVIQSTEGFDVGELVRKNKTYLDRKWSNEPAGDTIVLSRAVYSSFGDKPGLGVLNEERLELMQRYFIDSLRNQTNKFFTLHMVVGMMNEATKRIRSLDYGSINVEFIQTNFDLSKWISSLGMHKKVGRETDCGCPEDVVRNCGHPLTSIMARLDTDDWVAPGWIAHMKYMAAKVDKSHFLINYQVIGQGPDGRLHSLLNPYTSARISPFLVLVQKKEPRISPYADVHLRMGEKFSSVYTIPSSYAFMVVHGGNRYNKIQLFDDLHEDLTFKGVKEEEVRRIANVGFGGRRDSWKERIERSRLLNAIGMG